jgi:ribosomal protein S27AE
MKTEIQSCKCPRCGKHPVLIRYQKRFWRARCPTDHFPSIESTPMATRVKAIEVWNLEYTTKEDA